MAAYSAAVPASWALAALVRVRPYWPRPADGVRPGGDVAPPLDRSAAFGALKAVRLLEVHLAGAAAVSPSRRREVAAFVAIAGNAP